MNIKERCTGFNYKSITKTICFKCNVGLCIDFLFFFYNYEKIFYNNTIIKIMS